MRNDLVWVSPISYSFAFENSGVKFMQEFYILAKLSLLLGFYQGNSRKPQLGKLLRRTWCSKSFHYQYLSTIGSNNRAVHIWAFHIKKIFFSIWSSEATKDLNRPMSLVFSTLCMLIYYWTQRTQLGLGFFLMQFCLQHMWAIFLFK